MDDDSLRDVCEQLAEEISEEHRDRPGKRWRCPEDLRSRVLSYTRVCRERGEAIDDISRRLGLVNSTLARWIRADQKELQAGFRSVSIVPAEDGGGADRGGDPIQLTTPAGYTVDGLDAQTLAFLLRVVG